MSGGEGDEGQIEEGGQRTPAYSWKSQGHSLLCARTHTHTPQAGDQWLIFSQILLSHHLLAPLRPQQCEEGEMLKDEGKGRERGARGKKIAKRMNIENRKGTQQYW